MKLADALKQFGPVRGQTSIIAAVMSSNYAPVDGAPYVGESLTEAHKKLTEARTAQEHCGSDWAYWGYQGDISYWSAVVNILEAAEITGPDNLPDITFVSKGGVVMDVCAEQERYGRQMLEAARASK